MGGVARFLYFTLVLILAGCQSQPIEKSPVNIEMVKPVQGPPAIVECEKPVIPEPVVKKECPKVSPKAEKKHDLPVIGQVEKVVIMPGGLILKARIDTGATTSSIGSDDIEHYERDGKPWVKFNIMDPKTKKKHAFNVKRVRKVRIKQHEGEDYLRRPVVKLRVIMGKIDHILEFTLSDRTNFDYPVLIGRNFLMDAAIVDVSEKFITHTRVPKKKQ